MPGPLPQEEFLMRLSIFIILLAIAAGVPLQAAEPDRIADIRATAGTVERIFEAYASDNHLPGLAYGVVAGGELVLSGAFGYTDLERRTPADTDSLFRIASMSKSFTALAILQLRDAGKLALDEPAVTYLPELAETADLTSDAPPITVRHLLTHAAGFPEDNPWGDRQLDDSDGELVALVEAGLSLSNVPGITYEYSNLGFAMLGQIVQRVSGMPFTEYMAKYVFEPLGMKSTVWDFDDAPRDRLALGYGWRDGEWFDEPLLHHGSFGAMGGLITSIEDFGRYAALHLAAWPPRSGEDAGPLQRSSLREMHRPWNFSGLNPDFTYANGRRCPTASAYAYGLGWRSDCDGRVFIRHSGGLPGFGSNWTMMPDFDIAVISFDNRTYVSTDSVNVEVLDTIIREAGLAARVPEPSAALLDRAAALVSVLPDFDAGSSAGLFAENFFLDTPLDIRRRDAAGMFASAGTIREVHPVRPVNRLRGSILLDGERGDLRIFFTLTPEREPKIQQLDIVAVP